jgi:serine/threonine-protein kinase RsbW
MHDADSIEGPARMARLPDFHDRIDRFCVREALPHAMALHLQLLFEELFTNTVTHGHRGDCDVPVRLSLRRLADAVEMDYEDGAPPFDLVAAGRQAVRQRAQRLRELKVGGVGLSLLVELCSAASYARRGNRNLVCMRLPIGDLAA